MIKINIRDVKGVLKQYELPSNFRQSVAKQIQQQLLAETYSNIVDKANNKLKTSKQQYIDGLNLKNNCIELEGWLPNAIETGISGFDMKANFARSPKAKPSKTGGWYLTIPFAIKTPSARYGTTMSWQIYRAVREGRKYDAGRVQTRAAFSVMNTGRVFDAYQHKNPILQGIQRTPGNANRRASYNTFRRVSDKSNPNSWIHTGIMAHNLFDKAWADVDVEEIIDGAINSL